MKPFGKCGSCKFINKCNVDSQTMAKVVECVYSHDFDKKDTKVAPKKTK